MQSYNPIIYVNDSVSLVDKVIDTFIIYNNLAFQDMLYKLFGFVSQTHDKLVHIFKIFWH